MMKLTQPKTLLHMEGAILLAMSLFLYAWLGGNWWLFALLFLAPDLAMAGYIVNKEMGAAIYNLAHIYVWPAALVAVGVLTANPLALHLALIWLAHIGGDRLMGYGLKYTTQFKDTHLSHV
jgi:hypothetical protein